MPRKPRIEIGGGLYHIITRGNNRRKIFRSHDDYLKFTSLLQQQKNKLPFYLYAYCLMPNHFHLLIEMKDDRQPDYAESPDRLQPIPQPQVQEDRAPLSRPLQVDSLSGGSVPGR